MDEEQPNFLLRYFALPEISTMVSDIFCLSSVLIIHVFSLQGPTERLEMHTKLCHHAV